MDIVSAIVPPLVVAVAFLAIARAVIRHTDGVDPADRDISGDEY